MMLRASCAIPLLIPEIKIDEKPYFDGGIVAPIPVKRAIEQGYKKHLIILTNPHGHVKKQDIKDRLVAHLLKKRYPNLVKRIHQFYEHYNEQLAFCHQLESEGKALILKPNYALKDFEKILQQINKSYQMGFQQAKERLQEIKQFLS